ncbi:hypothetical protein K2173_014300 [Erythroxylum novogranatense]|uniref:Uncharacterized protein n=1 Tax=Erythroxylum novogranatense TaxID=1862640 RepID=A0AAV8SDY5_9ROSI|nr:hypothetical protein K2173_014300 [Erythroxylum novogranatense]
MGFTNPLFTGSMFLLILGLASSCNAQLSACKFQAIFQFGDELSDTGNSIQEFSMARHARLPYGQTMNKATGRSSDGLLIIDYFLNFAVAGVTAMSAGELTKFNLLANWSSNSLDVQLKWFDEFLKATCSDKDACSKKIKSSLFVLGEIGSNDYNYAFSRQDKHMSPEEVKKTMVPVVVKAIIEGVQHLISRGAVRIVVPGIFPLGCSPYFQTSFKSSPNNAKDKYGCLKEYNDAIMYHNEQLQKAILKIKGSNPGVHILYGDLYATYIYVLENAQKLGFKETLKACCGSGGGPYNFDWSALCGDKSCTVCSNPNEYVSWDGQHMTQHMHKFISEVLITDLTPKLQCGSSPTGNKEL